MSPAMHSLRIADADGVSERLVAGKERLTIKTGVGADLVTRKVSDLGRVEFTPGLAGGGSVFVCSADGHAAWHPVTGAGRFELGDERWPISQLGAFLLAEPVTPKPVEHPYRPGTWRVHFQDGSSSLLEGVSHFEDLADWVFGDGGMAVPPAEVEAVV